MVRYVLAKTMKIGCGGGVCGGKAVFLLIFPACLLYLQFMASVKFLEMRMVFMELLTFGH